MKKIYKFIALALLLTSFAVYADLGVQTHIIGLPEGAALKNATLAIKTLKSKSPINSEAKLYIFQKKASKDIISAIKPFGYFSANISSKIIKSPQDWFIEFNITPGTVVKISQVKVSIEGDARNNKHFKHLLAHLPLKVGQTLNTNKYKKLKERLSLIAATYGYQNSRIIKSQILINLNTHKAKIVLKFKSGKRSRFGDTTFSKTTLNQKFLKKYLTYKKGDYYNSKKIQISQKNLTHSGYFSRVLASPVLGNKNNLLTPVSIQLKPQLNQKYTFGAGYGTDTDFRGTIGININRVTSFGHKFNTIIQGSKLTSSIVLNYLIPYPDPTKNLITLSGGWGFLNEYAGNTKVQKLTATYSSQLGRWQQKIALTALNEHYNIRSFKINTNTRMIYPSIEWTYKKSDNSLKPNNGVNLDFNILGTPDFLSSNKGFAQFRFNSKFLYTLDATHTRLLLRGKVARTNIEDIIRLPLSLQLLAGGTQSVRGFQYNSIGPDKNLFIGSVEIQQKIYGNWYLSGFCDAGSVTAKFTQLLNRLYIGIGPGIVWRTPIGMAELTLGFDIYNKGQNQKKTISMIGFEIGPFL